ncbi:MAG: hypothetical protein JXA30_16715 [Deltaproteobacteria bacterium]|nr:hypothetical protein [Deltaproteobacteria bacterium]
MSKFQEYLDKQGIDTRRILVASKRLESLKPEDRSIKLLRRTLKKDENSKKDGGEKKPRSGRPIANPTLNRAIRGERLSGAAKSRLLRAVNAVLKQKKQPEASLTDLF